MLARPDGRAHPKQYEQLFRAQQGLCAMCREPEHVAPRLAVYVDMPVGAVRGLVCSVCLAMLNLCGGDLYRFACGIAFLVRPGPRCMTMELAPEPEAG